jgi:WhiB family transcriptional regulator, redox-sensing transcriptional regulator
VTDMLLTDPDEALAYLQSLTEPPADEDWPSRALCAQVDPDLFFPEKGGSVREAKAVCRGCEVREPCLRYALERDERFGIYGGFSERERRRTSRTWREPGALSLAETIAEDDAKFRAKQELAAERRRLKGRPQVVALPAPAADRCGCGYLPGAPGCLNTHEPAGVVA